MVRAPQLVGHSTRWMVGYTIPSTMWVVLGADRGAGCMLVGCCQHWGGSEVLLDVEVEVEHPHLSPCRQLGTQFMATAKKTVAGSSGYFVRAVTPR